jgi:anaerobic dimethyl sulfoxide reductase subunit A
MAAALQAMTGNIGILGGCAEGVGKGWHAESVAYPYDEYANVWWASIKSDRWAHCVLNYPNVKREEIGCWPRATSSTARFPTSRASSGRARTGSTSSPTSTRKSRPIKKLELVVCMDSTITPSGLWADVLLPIATHFERHDVALPWYKGHYYIHRPKVIEPLGESKTDFQVFTELAYRLEKLDPDLKDFGKRYNPRASATTSTITMRSTRPICRTGGRRCRITRASR